MKRVGRILILGFLSIYSFGISRASAAQCYSTQAAMAYVNHLGVKVMVLRGANAHKFLPVGGVALKTVDFAAVLFNDKGEAALFFGNFDRVCGPYKLTKKQVAAFLRPA